MGRTAAQIMGLTGTDVIIHADSQPVVHPQKSVKMKIPVYQPDISGNEKKYVCDCLDSNWISSKGKYVHLFEDGFASHIGAKYCASVSNGTAALQVALGALGIGPGDEVIVPTFTYIASVNTIAATGAKPVFVDSLPDTWQADPDAVAQSITPKTRAIMAVHLYGGMCDMDRLTALCKKHKLLLIEDCAEALGSTFNGKQAGTFGDVATFSFYGNKTITTGEGGMVVSRTARLHNRVMLYKGQGLSPHREYWHDTMGFNYRMTNICCAIGLAQLERLEDTIQRKQKVVQQYRKELSGLPLEFQAETDKVFHTHWMFSILCATHRLRNDLRHALDKAGVETRPLFPPVHMMPMYNHTYQDFPHAEELSHRGMNLPSWPGLERNQIAHIADA